MISLAKHSCSFYLLFRNKKKKETCLFLSQLSLFFYSKKSNKTIFYNSLKAWASKLKISLIILEVLILLLSLLYPVKTMNTDFQVQKFSLVKSWYRTILPLNFWILVFRKQWWKIAWNEQVLQTSISDPTSRKHTCIQFSKEMATMMIMNSIWVKTRKMMLRMC